MLTRRPAPTIEGYSKPFSHPQLAHLSQHLDTLHSAPRVKCRSSFGPSIAPRIPRKSILPIIIARALSLLSFRRVPSPSAVRLAVQRLDSYNLETPVQFSQCTGQRVQVRSAGWEGRSATGGLIRIFAESKKTGFGGVRTSITSGVHALALCHFWAQSVR